VEWWWIRPSVVSSGDHNEKNDHIRSLPALLSDQFYGMATWFCSATSLAIVFSFSVERPLCSFIKIMQCYAKSFSISSVSSLILCVLQILFLLCLMSLWKLFQTPTNRYLVDSKLPCNTAPRYASKCGVCSLFIQVYWNFPSSFTFLVKNILSCITFQSFHSPIWTAAITECNGATHWFLTWGKFTPSSKFHLPRG